MNLTTASTNNGATVTCTIANDDGVTVEIFTVKDGNAVIRRIDRKLSDLMWNRSGFGVGMTATLSRPALFNLLTTVNAR